VDIPFIRFAFPLLILYLFWNTFIVNPWVEEPVTETSSNPNYISPNAARALLEQSRAMIVQQRYEEALGPLNRLHKAYPEDHIYIQQLAENYDRLGLYKEGGEMWEQYLQNSPTPIEGCPQIAFDYQKQNKRAEAFKAFERCWMIEANADMIFYYAHVLEIDGQFAKALKLYQDGFKRAPDYPDIEIGLARVQARLGENAAAKPEIDAVLQKRPDDVDALLVAGMVYSGLGDARTALQHLRHAQKLSPQDNDVRLVLARVSRQGSSQ
jgi:tetratricopeptide (TPR) repeat protein